MKNPKKFYFLPKTRLGKGSFFIVILSFIGLFIQYWLSISGLFQTDLALPGILMGCALIICGISSIISILKYRDYAIVLFLSSLLGLLGIMFIIGEFIFPH